MADETVDHLISSCSFLVQREYKGRHDAIASLIHWTLLKQAGVQVQTPWRKHVPTAVLDTNDFKLLWDFTIISDSAIYHNRPDITLVRKPSNEVFLIDVAIPGESRIAQKGIEKLTKYVDLKIEVSRLWRSRKVSVIPIIVGALGSIPIDLPRYLEMIELPLYLMSTFQSTVLHRTTSILRRYMNI